MDEFQDVESIQTAIEVIVQKEGTQRSLAQLCAVLEASSLTPSLDPLVVMPLLIPYQCTHAVRAIRVVSEKANAKEILLVLQEILERLSHDDDQEDEEEQEEKSERLSPTLQLERVVFSYTYILPRVLPKEKTTGQRLQGVLHDLGEHVQALVPHSHPREGQAVLHSVTALTNNLLDYFADHLSDATQLTPCVDALFSLLDVTLAASVNHLHTYLAQRTFEALYPKLVVNSAIDPDWNTGERLVLGALAAANRLGYDTTSLSSNPTLGKLTLLAHIDLQDTDHFALLETYSPIILACLRSNNGMDEASAFLLAHISAMTLVKPHPPSLPFDFMIKFAFVLPSLMGVHPDPPTRHMLFRLTALTLSLTEPSLRAQILMDMLTDSTYSPQTRIAAISLVKESVLHALNGTSVLPVLSPLEDVFGTSLFLEILGPVLFRSNPHDLFDSPTFDPDEFLFSPEPNRLIECLSFYYVLIQRDTENRTGIRDRIRVADMEHKLLRPLRGFLERYNTLNKPEVILAFAGLQTSLERVDSALKDLLKGWGYQSL
ncbi:hypothetical protein BJ322DRAFT_1045414 [Thelephora terrestris]|uniref:Uncharacterized protein n=1 Tax=Thelephora terrestris TaxID=56493 RepID=A0A9P6HK24_9AGAM|nr:hypothetical protein BJ322DRAFT_1045414 [Thelephora terrestris]